MATLRSDSKAYKAKICHAGETGQFLSAERKWKGVSHEKRREIIERFLRRNFSKRARIFPAHSVSHHVNGARVVKWFARKTGMNEHSANIAELAYMLHDLKKELPEHARAAAHKAMKLLSGRTSEKDAALISFAIYGHNMPLRIGKKLGKVVFPANEAVIFADRMEVLGAYGAMRISAYMGESWKNGSANVGAVIPATIKEAETQIAYSKNIGAYKNGKPLIVFPAKKYFPKAVMGLYGRGIREMEAFVSALKGKQPWAEELQDYFFEGGISGKKDLNELITEFRPGTAKAKEMRAKAIAYIKGEF